MTTALMPNWTKINPGSTILFKDIASLELSKKLTGKLESFPLVVERTAHLKDNIANWFFVYFKPRRDEMGELLVIQRVDNEEELFFYQLSEFPVNNRRQNILDGNMWLFQDASDPLDFQPLSLVYTNSIEEVTSAGEKIEYFKKQMGERTGKYYEIPERQGMYNLLGTFIPYSAKDGKQALLLEIGQRLNEDGGAIFLYTGRQIDNSEVEVFHSGN